MNIRWARIFYHLYLTSFRGRNWGISDWLSSYFAFSNWLSSYFAFSDWLSSYFAFSVCTWGQKENICPQPSRTFKYSMVSLYFKLSKGTAKNLCCLYYPAKEKWRDSRFFIHRVHGSTRMFRVYSIIILHENATVRRTVLPKVVKQNAVSHYFRKKLSKLDVSQNTRKKWRISSKDLKILGKMTHFN